MPPPGAGNFLMVWPEYVAVTDDELLARTAAGDREAFAALYRRRRPDVYRFALHMCGAHATAEDIVQEVFLAVIQQAARFDPARAGALTWLLGIARNHVRRHRAMTWARRVTSWVSGHAPAIDLDPSIDIAQREEVAALRRLVAGLPIRYREAIVLCDLRELSYEDAAVVMRCAVGTVRSRLHRGRALLGERLKQHERLFRTAETGILV